MISYLEYCLAKYKFWRRRDKLLPLMREYVVAELNKNSKARIAYSDEGDAGPLVWLDPRRLLGLDCGDEFLEYVNPNIKKACASFNRYTDSLCISHPIVCALNDVASHTAEGVLGKIRLLVVEGLLTKEDLYYNYSMLTCALSRLELGPVGYLVSGVKITFKSSRKTETARL